MSVMLATNPGRWAKVETRVGFRFEATRLGPDALMVSSRPRELVLTEEAATAMMRALASVLGYEIGERHEY